MTRANVKARLMATASRAVPLDVGAEADLRRSLEQIALERTKAELEALIPLERDLPDSFDLSSAP